MNSSIFSRLRDVVKDIVRESPDFKYYRDVYGKAVSDKEKSAILDMLTMIFIEGGHTKMLEVQLRALEQDILTDSLAKKLGWKF